ncbi:MAG: YiiX/YebB-like N1pC/P60 family cysteine hydrolase [Candidatus Nomurabacteria bacterium]|nr:YiiX/YebB-like N1pC/P60 family cysteine hydrolase [Candidatus Nomurabacteria bacterium]
MSVNFLKSDIKKLKLYYSKNKRLIVKFILLAILFLFLAMAIVGLRILYPYHFLLSLPFLILSTRYLFSAFLLNSNKVTRSDSFIFVKKVVIKYEKILFIISIIGIIFYVISRILPSDNNPFENIKKEEISSFVNQSVDVSVLLIDNIETTGNELLGSGLLNKKEFTVDELQDLQAKWNNFLQATKDSEDVTDIYRYFGKISYFSRPNEHTKSFIISYSLYLKKFELFGRIIQATGNNERVIKALNEYSPVFGGKNSYYDIRNRHVGHETFLRRNLGRLYAFFLEKTVDESTFGENYNTLLRESKESHNYLLTNIRTTAGITAFKIGDDVENGLFNSWFPIQKNVANTMGNILVSSRKETFITLEQIQEMKLTLRPGDIFIERRNWHASNVGIPGFWPHAALYIGTLQEADAFFQELFPLEGYTSYSLFVMDKYPKLYEKYTSKDSNGYEYAVIEGQAPGIILLPLEKSAKADYLGVVRPRLEKSDTLKAILRSFENFGKPYDYNFDFETRDELVCSDFIFFFLLV